MTKKLYFVSLGCPRNTVDSEIIIKRLLNKNFLLTNKIKDADVFVVNTCAFLKEARDEVFEILDEVFETKKKEAKVIITGCMANLFSKELIKKYDKNIFSIISAGNLDNISQALEERKILTDKLSYLPEDYSRILINYPHLAYLKISEGCFKKCSFCIIPKIKGKLKSRSTKSIIEEFKLLLSKNVFEFNLIAQDLLDYGKDRNEKNAFLKLLNELLKIEKDYWLRLLYVYPDEITDEFISFLASDERICKYLDIPIQHISDKILKNMNRKTSKQKILKIFEKLKAKIPNISIRASFIVGFPNETDDDFNKLLAFIENYPIDHLAVFKYSNEKLCKAYNFKNHIPKKIKQERFDLLTQKQFLLTQKRNKKLIGKTTYAIIDGYHSNTKLLAMARNYSQAFKIDSNIIINDVQKIHSFGKVHKIKITDISEYDLIASPL